MGARTTILALGVATGALAACVAPAPVDGGVLDGGGATCSENVPEPSDPCLPTCGNELGVGQPCTQGGGECSDFVAVQGGAALCTVDWSDTTLAFCTKACVADDQCGSGAVCSGDPEDPAAGSGCVPASCAEEPVDAGTPDDAGTTTDGG